MDGCCLHVPVRKSRRKREQDDFQWADTLRKHLLIIKGKTLVLPMYCLVWIIVACNVVVSTDASFMSPGAVRYRIDGDGKQRVIAYASRGLKKFERNYAN